VQHYKWTYTVHVSCKLYLVNPVQTVKIDEQSLKATSIPSKYVMKRVLPEPERFAVPVHEFELLHTVLPTMIARHDFDDTVYKINKQVKLQNCFRLLKIKTNSITDSILRNISTKRELLHGTVPVEIVHGVCAHTVP